MTFRSYGAQSFRCYKKCSSFLTVLVSQLIFLSMLLSRLCILWAHDFAVLLSCSLWSVRFSMGSSGAFLLRIAFGASNSASGWNHLCDRSLLLDTTRSWKLFLDFECLEFPQQPFRNQTQSESRLSLSKIKTVVYEPILAQILTLSVSNISYLCTASL